MEILQFIHGKPKAAQLLCREPIIPFQMAKQFSKTQADSVYCKMTNAAFPDFTSSNALNTTIKSYREYSC